MEASCGSGKAAASATVSSRMQTRGARNLSDVAAQTVGCLPVPAMARSFLRTLKGRRKRLTPPQQRTMCGAATGAGRLFRWQAGRQFCCLSSSGGCAAATLRSCATPRMVSCPPAGMLAMQARALACLWRRRRALHGQGSRNVLRRWWQKTFWCGPFFRSVNAWAVIVRNGASARLSYRPFLKRTRPVRWKTYTAR